jgi:integrase
MPKKLSNALKPLTVKNAKPGRHADGGGLNLLVKESGARSWVYRFMLRGKSRDIGLGPAAGLDAVSLADARDLAAGLRLKVKTGVDPIEERDRIAAEGLASAQASKVAAITFKAVAEAHIAANEDSWRNPKHRQQWSNTLATYVYPVIGDMPVAEVATPHVLSILEPIWKAKAETASRVRGRIETVLDSAKARGYREGENPARWRGHLALILPVRSKLTRGHHPALPYEQVAAFVAELRKREAMAALALEFTILTAARTGEAIGASWHEIDTEKVIWTVPAKRHKTGKEHRVPLTPRAIVILESARMPDSEWLFTGTNGHLSNMAMSALIKRMHESETKAGRLGYIDPKQGRVITSHGFRSTFRDWASERTNYQHEVKERALSHVIGNKAEAAYRRDDLLPKRRRLMGDWEGYCSNGNHTGTLVTPIRSNVA